jgi:hypothetical protein
MTKTPATLARQMERVMQRAGRDCFRYRNEHCTLFENDLECICPIKDQNRKNKLAEFAAQYGFRLRFYHKGLFAIFGKRTARPAMNVDALCPSIPCSAMPAK